ncbi:MAG: endonuclease/exonuclease/phosphatase family protein [Clostridia bacterium]|nr:endonuclease/exonuclease/phosphatase family protein [Clostridia bacterium]
MKTLLKILAISLCLVIVLALVVEFLYLPGYLLDGETVPLSRDDGTDITVMSCNVRYYNPLDLFERSWFYRAPLIRRDVSSVMPDVIGFQEVTFVHYGYLERIMQGYASEIAYRDDFILSEGCPIFYRTDKYRDVESGSFWLSETPEVMSKDWGSDHYRIATYILLEDIKSGERFTVFNAHLDNVSEEARINGIGVVLDKIEALGCDRAILMGDLNDFPDSPTIASALGRFDDAYELAAERDEGATYHAWGEKPDRDRIDYIMITKGDATVSEYRIVDNCHDGVYSSDHSSIYAVLRFN